MTLCHPTHPAMLKSRTPTRVRLYMFKGDNVCSQYSRGREPLWLSGIKAVSAALKILLISSCGAVVCEHVDLIPLALRDYWFDTASSFRK